MTENVSKPLSVGFIGLGRMGLPLACHLARAGVVLSVFDTQPERAGMVQGENTAVATSVAELAASSDVVFMMLPGPKEVRAVALSDNGILANVRAGATIVDLSTVDVETVDLLAAETAKRGLSFADAPVGRLAAHADRGESLFMVGANEKTLQTIRPLLDNMGTTVMHCGRPGHGTRTKLINNFMVMCYCQINSEALCLANGLGLDLDQTLEVLLGTTASNGQLRDKWRNKVLGGDLTPGFALTLGIKDLTLACASAASSGVSVPMGNTALSMFRLAAHAGYGDKDTSSLTDFWAQSNGQEPLRLKS